MANRRMRNQRAGENQRWWNNIPFSAFFTQCYIWAAIIGLTLLIGVLCYLNYGTGSKSGPPAFPEPKQPEFKLFNGTPLHVMYIVGDSTVAAGDFSMTPTPYGVDWAEPIKGDMASKGRFSNGYTFADYIASAMGMPQPRPWVRNMPPTTDGINFGSGGCGLKHSTRPFEGFECSSIGIEQIHQVMYGPYVWNKNFLDNGLILISAEGNDLMFAYKEGRDLHDIGGRTFLVNNVGPLGCIPNKLVDNFCNGTLNHAAMLYNNVLSGVLSEFRARWLDSTIVYADSYGLFSFLLKDHGNFKNTTGACCGDWKEHLQMFECNMGAPLSSKAERQSFLFFNGAHTTPAANKVFAKKCL